MVNFLQSGARFKAWLNIYIKRICHGMIALVTKMTPKIPFVIRKTKILLHRSQPSNDFLGGDNEMYSILLVFIHTLIHYILCSVTEICYSF